MILGFKETYSWTVSSDENEKRGEVTSPTLLEEEPCDFDSLFFMSPLRPIF